VQSRSAGTSAEDTIEWGAPLWHGPSLDNTRPGIVRAPQDRKD
jgi:hypothetical protein